MSSKSTYGDSAPMAQRVTAGSDAKVRMWSPDTDRSEMRKLGEIIWNEPSRSPTWHLKIRYVYIKRIYLQMDIPVWHVDIPAVTIGFFEMAHF